ncbi:MAG: hypothetical protein WCI19_07030 [Betaproteobacteria bacterium]
MKRYLIAGTLVAAVFGSPVFAADVGVSVSIGQSGFYGRIEIGDFPKPVVIYSQPVVIQRGSVSRLPIYLRVPPGHARNWKKHCHKYDACGERVYFVKDDWYNKEYVPRYQERNGGRRENNRGEDRRDGRGDDHDKGKGPGRKD